MAVISMKDLLECGVHFGHQTRKWNPKMKKFIFTSRNDIHIINLEDTVKQAEIAYNLVRDVVKEGKSVLFVGTKKQAAEAIEAEAKRCGAFYVNSRWLGGTLTNFKTIRSSIEKMKKIEQMEKTGEFDLLPKKEVVKLKQTHEKLFKNLDGIRDMVEMPGVIFVVDSKKESIAIKEARLMNIPLIGLIDTNCDPDEVDICIPGNDDAIRSIKLIAGSLANAVIEAKEGVEMVQIDDVDEDFDLSKAIEGTDIEQAAQNELMEDAESKKKKAKKKKPYVKKEEKADDKQVQEEQAEQVAEVEEKVEEKIEAPVEEAEAVETAKEGE